MEKATYIEGFNLEKYLTGGVENIVRGAIKATLKDPKESAFMVRYGLASKEASKKRAAAESRKFYSPFLPTEH